MTADELDYVALLQNLDEKNSKEKLLISLRDWFHRSITPDPENGEPLDDDLTHFLDELPKINSYAADKNVCDWLYYILDYSGKAMLHIFESPRKEVLRFHEQMPLYQAKEIDTAGIMEIARRPGRTVREKISSKPSVIAVKRQQSVDTLENRLLKKLVTKIIYILEERQNIFSGETLQMENEDSKLSIFYAKLRRWLRMDEAQEIGTWQNVPPNNVLLCDKYYKKVWTTWRYLLELSDIIADDLAKIDACLAAYIFWNTASILQQQGGKIKQLPLCFDLNNFLIKAIGYPFDKEGAVIQAEDFALRLKVDTIIYEPISGKSHIIRIGFDRLEIDGKKIRGQLKNLEAADTVSEKLANSISKSKSKRIIPVNNEEQQAFTVIDFSAEPYDSISNQHFENDQTSMCVPYPAKLLRQFWKTDDSSDISNIDCGVSPARYDTQLNNYKITTVTFDAILHESITNKEIPEKIKSEAIYYFMNSLRDYYNTNNFYYVLPDYLEDFSLGLIRSTANVVFTNANPIPKSVGAVFDFQASVDFTSYAIKENDFVFVIEKKQIYDKAIFAITPLCAKTSYRAHDNAKEINLNTITDIPGGVRWEHHPPIIINEYQPEKIMDYIQKTVKSTEDISSHSSIYIISAQESIKDARLNMPHANWIFINSPFNAVRGIAYSVKLQHRVKDIPLWCEHLPNLKMSVIKRGKRIDINLTNGKTVLPIRGTAQEISISETFILSKNVHEYHFRLVRGTGENKASLKYEACLKHPSFPLKYDTTCNLNMRYTYGQEQPFELYFVPSNSSSFVRAKVEWKKIDESTFPVPNFPPQREWNEFVHSYDVIKKEQKNLIEWEENNFDYIAEIQNFYLGKSNNLNRYSFAITHNFMLNYRRDVQGYYYLVKSVDDKYLKIYRNQFQHLKDDEYFSISINTKRKPSDDTGVKIYYTIGLAGGVSLSKKIISSLARRLRFPTMQIWNNRKSVLELPNVPNDFKEKITQTKSVLYDLLNNENVKKQNLLWNELFLLACTMHKDGIDITENFIRERLAAPIDFEQNRKLIEQQCFQFGYFIGTAEYPLQKDVFNWALTFDNSNDSSTMALNHFKLQILTIALWRCESLLESLSIDQLEALFNQTVKAIEYEYERNENEKKLSNRKLNPLRSHLELLCALIRSRNFGAEYRQLFSPFNPKIQKLISEIEKIYEWLYWNQKNLYARQIKFTVSDEKSDNSFLDYLLLWLDGEKSTEMPRIESATDDTVDTDEDLDDDIAHDE